MSECYVLWTSRPVARVHHVCESCGRTINPGEPYRRDRGLCEGEPYTWKECQHCIAFVSLYFGEFGYEGEGWTADAVEEWEPSTDLAREHKRRWSIGWRHGRDLYPVPTVEAVNV